LIREGNVRRLVIRRSAPWPR